MVSWRRLLPEGGYGTSFPIKTVLDEENDMILAYSMNGEEISPDHGYPLTLIAPGNIGGRMVKWLDRIKISDSESDSVYHLEDNRKLSKQIGFVEAFDPNVWKDPSTLIYQLNINSAILLPKHEQWIELGEEDVLRIQGYAYAGEGQKVSKVEVKFGLVWESCQSVVYPSSCKSVPRHGSKFWTLCMLEHNIQCKRIKSVVSRLKDCPELGELTVRAWDSRNIGQPQHPTWNILGVMNNCWYTTKLEYLESDDRKSIQVKLLHPVAPHLDTGGWMEKYFSRSVASQRYFPLFSVSSSCHITLNALAGKCFDMEMVSRHCTDDDCWVVINGYVYDVSSYFSDHPGGTSSIMCYAGKDASIPFYDIHAEDAQEIKERFLLGPVVEKQLVQTAISREAECSLMPEHWSPVEIIEKKKISRDSYIFRLQILDYRTMMHSRKRVGLPIGQHVLIRARISDQFVVRPYTPIKPVLEDEDQDAMLEFLIKIYRKTESNPGGKMTTFLETLEIGDKTSLKIKGPAGKMLFQPGGILLVRHLIFKVDHFLMVCGGTGITPMLQLLRVILLKDAEREEDLKEPIVDMIFASQSTQDILMKDELDFYRRVYSDSFNLWYTVDQISAKENNWRFGVGHISPCMMKRRSRIPKTTSIALLCGPPMMTRLARRFLILLGWREDQIHEF